MTLSPESIEAFRSTLARRMRLAVLLVAAVAFVGWSVIAWIEINAATPGFYWVFVYLGVAWLVGPVIMTVVLRRGLRRLVDFLTVMTPRGRLVSPPGSRAPLLLLDNDLLFRFQPSTTFRLFFSATGEPISPDVAEAKRWVATVRLRRVGQVTRTRGDPSLRAELDQISTRLGSRLARLVVFDRVRVDASNPRSPIRDALAVFPLRDTLKTGEPILRELDSIRHLLVQAAFTWPLGSARPIS
jgi:hypothetical protein